MRHHRGEKNVSNAAKWSAQKLGNTHAELIQSPSKYALWPSKTLGYAPLYGIFPHLIPVSFSPPDRYLSLRKQLFIIFPLIIVQYGLSFLHNQTYFQLQQH